jgi:hypothetical protein
VYPTSGLTYEVSGRWLNEKLEDESRSCEVGRVERGVGREEEDALYEKDEGWTDQVRSRCCCRLEVGEGPKRAGFSLLGREAVRVWSQ